MKSIEKCVFTIAMLVYQRVTVKVENVELMGNCRDTGTHHLEKHPSEAGCATAAKVDWNTLYV